MRDSIRYSMHTKLNTNTYQEVIIQANVSAWYKIKLTLHKVVTNTLLQFRNTVFDLDTAMIQFTEKENTLII